MNTCRHTTPQKLSISNHYRVEKEFGKMSNLNLQIRQLHYTPSTWVKKPWLYMGLSTRRALVCVHYELCIYSTYAYTETVNTCTHSRTLTPRLLHTHPYTYTETVNYTYDRRDR